MTLDVTLIFATILIFFPVPTVRHNRSTTSPPQGKCTTPHATINRRGEAEVRPGKEEECGSDLRAGLRSTAT